MAKNKTHLLQLVQGLGVGGAEVLLLHYIRSLDSEKYQHFVYCFGYDGPIRKNLEDLGIPVHFGPQRASIKNPVKFLLCLCALLKDLASFIKNNRIDIIQSHLRHANQLAIGVSKLSGVPAFPTIHNTMEFVDPRSFWDMRVHIFNFVNRLFYPKQIALLRFRKKSKKSSVANFL